MFYSRFAQSTDIGVSESLLAIPVNSLQRCPDLVEWAGSIANLKVIATSLYHPLNHIPHVVYSDGVF
jgi:hypothetical protein